MESGSRHTFFSGFKSGVFTSALMFGLYGAVHGLFAMAAHTGGGMLAFFPLGATAVPMLLAIGLFSGIMAVRRGHEEAKTAREVSRQIVREVSTARGLSPELASEVETSRGQGSWADRVGGARSTDQSYSDRILSERAAPAQLGR
jgi:hypothetical protein